MPTYDYECEQCGTFEIFQNIKEESLTNCPTCNGPIKRIISGGSGFILKGSGFYVNDYAKPGCSKKECSAKEQVKAEDPLKGED